MPRRLSRVWSLGLVVVACALTVAAAGARFSPPDLVVHEWGTFTTVAGADGRATDWLPLGGPTDLPCFVTHYQNPQFKVILDTASAPVDYEHAREGLSGKVRMETPVIYFYTPRDQVAHVSVAFPRGLMTEWYPDAVVSQPPVQKASLANPRFQSSITWNNIAITAIPRSVGFPNDGAQSHYYAARETDSASLEVNGQREKFLFYRGVASFDVPIAAQALDRAVRITNLGQEPLPNAIVFRKQGNALGFRVLGSLSGTKDVPLPALDGDFASLAKELERSLIAAGLFEREAKAMVATWRDSWFEEGVRVFYVLPKATVDAVLPLRVNPEPSAVARAFVGRMEVITPGQTTAQRFLGAVADRVLAANPDPATREQVQESTNAALKDYVSHMATCR